MNGHGGWGGRGEIKIPTRVLETANVDGNENYVRAKQKVAREPMRKT